MVRSPHGSRFNVAEHSGPRMVPFSTERNHGARKREPVSQSGSGLRAMRCICAAVAVLISAPVGPAQAEYNIASGDVLEITVFGFPDLTRRAPVSIDGDILVPLVGVVPVAGRPKSSVEATIKQLLAEKLVEERSIVRTPIIALEVAEHRPLYIKGDVAKPGAYPYRHRMTIRHVVALAGGYGRFKTANPLFGAIDLTGEYETLRAEFVRNQARLMRLQAELDGRTQLDLQPLQETPAGNYTVSQKVAQAEARQLTLRDTDHRAELQHLNRLSEHAERQLSVLNQQQKEEQSSVDLQSRELERLKVLFEKGMTPSNRLSDSQQSLALMKIRALENAARAAQTTQRKEELSRQLQRTVTQRQMDLIEKVQDAIVAVERTSARLNAVREKLLYTGAMTSNRSQGSESNAELLIFRKSDEVEVRLSADEDTEVLPGDVVEVSIRGNEIGMPFLTPEDTSEKAPN